MTPAEIERYKRHILLKEIGGPGQRKLLSGGVTIVGAGALGGPCALYLAAAGVGHIVLYDDDVVDRSNLQRQVQYTEADIGAPKVEVLKAALLARNSSISCKAIASRWTPEAPVDADVLIDATDSFQSRYDLNRTAHTSGIPLVSGAASAWTGQASVFASGLVEGAPCYRCFVPETPPELGTCDEIGVVGPVTGLIGTRLALEAIKVLLGLKDTLVGRLWLLDGLSGTSRTLGLAPDPACSVCGEGVSAIHS